MKYLSIPLILLLSAVCLLAGCSGRGPSGGNSGSGASGANTAQPGTAPYGTWYEQLEYGGTLEVTKKEIAYTVNDGSYTDRTSLKVTPGPDGTSLLEPGEEYFWFVEITYHKDSDSITARTMPVMDGDGGYKLRTFLRTPYVPPAPPVYDPPVDNSDPDAPKEFSDMTLQSLKVSFYEPGTDNNDGMMTPMPPFEGEYSYDLTVLEDGSASVSSSYCQEIRIPKETVDELQTLVSEAGLGSLNGLDVHTKGLPPTAADYTLELQLASGETIRSSANGYSVPEAWQAFQPRLQELLLHAFVEAGYQIQGDTFHSTEPMKRLGTGSRPHFERGGYYGQIYDTEPAPAVTVAMEQERLEPELAKSYDYDLHEDYTVFGEVTPANAPLSRTLAELNARFKASAENSVQEDFATMEAVPKEQRQSASNRYIYSFYVVERHTDHGLFQSFFMSEGHANSFGAGPYGHGYYPYYVFNVDTATGRILSAADVFADEDTAVQALCEAIRSRYGTHREEGQFIHSDAFPDALRKFVSKPAPEGITWTAGYHSVEFWLPQAMFPMELDYTPTVMIYYDELQDVLSDTFCSVW